MGMGAIIYGIAATVTTIALFKLATWFSVFQETRKKSLGTRYPGNGS